MSDVQFKPGVSYVGTATIDSERQKLFAVVARHGDVVSFAHIRDVKRELAEDCCGTEVVRIRDADGFDYFVSAQVEVDVDHAFNIVDMCQR